MVCVNRFSIFFLAGLLLCGIHPPGAQAATDDVAALQQEVRQLRVTVERLIGLVQTQQQQIDELRAKRPAVAVAPRPAIPPVPAPPIAPSPVREVPPSTRGAASLKALLPDISVVGDVVAILTESKEDEEGNDAINLRELEVNLGGWADPWTRYDATITFEDIEEKVEVEEAYLTRFGLPLGLVARAGKFRSNVSKVNQFHLDELPWVDEPRLIRDYLGEEGFISSGVRLSWLVPNPWDHYLEVTGEVLKGGSTIIASGTKRDPIFTAHVTNFFQLTDDIGLEVGASGLSASSPDRVAARRRDIFLYGGDSKLTWQGEQGRKLILMGEILRHNRDIGGADGTFDTTVGDFRNEDAVGWYASGEYYISPRWSFGGRYDWVEPLGVITEVDPATGEPSFNEKDGVRDVNTAAVGFLTFRQSELVRFRVQYRHDEFADNTKGFDEDDVVFFQANVTTGPHRDPIR